MIGLYESRLREMGLNLPVVPDPVAAYVPAVLSGKYVFTSGQLPLVAGELRYRGKLGREITEREGYLAARICALNCLAAVKGLVQDLDRIKKIVRVTGYVSSAPGFNNQPLVINGASELLSELFGEAGRHARAAVGVSELPLDAAVELDMVVELKGSY